MVGASARAGWSVQIRDAADALGFDPADPSTILIWSPGRVNLIGDHIDYSGGLVLPMAVDRGTRAVLRPRADSQIRGFSANFAEAGVHTAELSDTCFTAEHGWFSYVLGVVDTFAGRGLHLDHGFDLYLSGNIPVGSGLSSSASVELASGVAVNHLGGFGLSAADLAVIGQETENDYIGVSCGVMDQLAIAAGEDGSVLLMDCDRLTTEAVPFPTDEYEVVVANTNQPRKLAESAYNERRRSVEAALTLINRARREAGLEPRSNPVSVSEADLTDNAVELAAAGALPFARHTLTEQQRVLSAAEALRTGDVVSFGALMRQSHESLRDDFAVTGPNLDALAEAAWDAPGVVGARMTGAGFGGCTVNLVHSSKVDEAIAAIAPAYQSATGLTPEFFVVGPAAGARVLGAGEE